MIYWDKLSPMQPITSRFHNEEANLKDLSPQAVSGFELCLRSIACESETLSHYDVRLEDNKAAAIAPDSS